ncbi:AIR synthase family protein [Runella slithyformis]|uniref:AIR synthase related protein domain protein n=1 Tax=Runella slithyformis (strain ATCC 29530 / DSM 19594 / LMG 11500 / NCIMB 11436 / LSU 4) TaxID=761193 RepID=A0A7U3ZLW9_RUNSL|nr:AIR synthase family protein [Runella slithyformis]AEI49624.1 AIR synthase related protein domain protein [Runella slithyformis DSM 19594]
MKNDTGKITDEAFKNLVYPFCGASRPEVRIGPNFGTDISIIELPNGYEMALTSDPLSYIPNLGTEESAWLSVHLMANDMATTGVAPQYAQFVLNLPSYVSEADFQAYWQYIHRFCRQIGVAITGGHTGRFEGMNSTIAGGGTMIAIAEKGKMLCSQYAQPGNDIIVTKQAALIATSILARCFPNTVKEKCGVSAFQEASDLFYQTSSLTEGLTASAFNDSEGLSVTAMHDVTEGGILGAIYEMAVASRCGTEVEISLLPIGTVAKSVCDLFGIDPAYSVGAGSMVMAVKPEKTPQLIQKLSTEGISATRVGRFVSPENGINKITSSGESRIIPPLKDPYWAAFFKALNQGLT